MSKIIARSMRAIFLAFENEKIHILNANKAHFYSQKALFLLKAHV